MFVIVRHGNTFAAGSTPRRIGRRTDLPLTAEGCAQAQALGAHFAGLGWHFGRVLVSPLVRTRETARIILAQQPAPPPLETCDWLAEIDHGPDENQTEAAVLARIGADALTAWDTQALPPPGWIVDAEGRRQGWHDLFATPSPHPVLLVTSNGAARFALPATPATGLKLPTGSYGVIERAADGQLAIAAWGKRP